MFPTPDQLGIDLVLPDFAYLRERVDDVEAIVLTHGHEDHVGALPFFLRQFDRAPPIYGGPLTAAMVRSKLDEHRLKDVPVEDVLAGGTFEAGPFSVEMVKMAHSIPDSFAVALSCELGTMLVTGDYKFDQTPVDGVPADVGRLAELGREGLLLLCGDSTNADRPGTSPSESSVGPRLHEVFAPLQGPDRGHLLRVEHPSCAAGGGRGRRARTEGRAGGTLDAQEREHRPDARAHQRAGGPARGPQGDRGLPGPQGGDPVDRQPGRAALGAAPHGARRSPPRGPSRGRHRDLLGHVHSGQRAGGERDDRPHLPARRHGHHAERRSGARIGPRFRGGAQAAAQSHEAALRAAGARRPPPAEPARRAGRGGGDRPRLDLPRRERAAAGARASAVPASASASRRG